MAKKLKKNSLWVGDMGSLIIIGMGRSPHHRIIELTTFKEVNDDFGDKLVLTKNRTVEVTNNYIHSNFTFVG